MTRRLRCIVEFDAPCERTAGEIASYIANGLKAPAAWTRFFLTNVDVGELEERAPTRSPLNEGMRHTVEYLKTGDTAGLTECTEWCNSAIQKVCGIPDDALGSQPTAKPNDDYRRIVINDPNRPKR